MSIRRIMLFTLGGFFKSIISLFKTRVLSSGGNFEAETNLENQLNTLGSDLFDSASLVITPNGVKTSKLYTIKPNDGTGDLDVVRATSATRVDEQGLVEIPVTNLILRSEEFNNVAWLKNGISVTENSIISPNGTITSDEITADGTTAIHTLWSQASITNGATYTYTIYAKKGTNNFLQLYWGVVLFGDKAWANFNLDTGVVGSVGSNSTASIQSIGNGWYRLITTATAIASGTQQIVASTLITSNTSPRAETNTLSTSVYLWGAQVEQGMTATEYIPTTSVIRTRFAGITQDGGSASNIPRIDYSNGSPAILVEPQRTNLVLRSEEFDNSYWTGVFPSTLRIPNIGIAPKKSQVADKLAESNNTQEFKVFRNNVSGLIQNANYTISVFAKAQERRYFYIQNPSGIGTIFDLINGIVIGNRSGAPVNSGIQNYGNGWYRCWIVLNTSASTTLIPEFGLLSGNNNITSYLGTQGSGVLIWGAQLEAGSNATSYIPTTTSSVTRNADVISNTNASNLIGQTEGCLFLDFVPTTVDSTARYISVSNSSSVSNGWFGIFASTSTNTFRFYGEGFDVNIGTLILNNRYKIVLNYKNGVVTKIFINGVNVSTITANNTGKSYNFIQLATAPIGTRGNANFNCISLFKNIISDQQAIQLTTL